MRFKQIFTLCILTMSFNCFSAGKECGEVSVDNQEMPKHPSPQCEFYPNGNLKELTATEIPVQGSVKFTPEQAQGLLDRCLKNKWGGKNILDLINPGNVRVRLVFHKKLFYFPVDAPDKMQTYIADKVVISKDCKRLTFSKLTRCDVAKPSPECDRMRFPVFKYSPTKSDE
jgi:hypothetical protein